MKKLTTLLAAMVFAICLVAIPGSVLAAIGVEVGVKGDLIYADWEGGNWLEEYAATDGSKYAIWIDEGGTGTAGNETGDYWFYQLSLDGMGGYTFNWDYNVLDLKESKFEVSNAVTGFYSLEYEYEDMTGAAGAFFKEEFNEIDPVAGYHENELTWKKDLDGDGQWWDNDWQYESWDWYEPGEGTGAIGYELLNWYGGIKEYENSFTSISGSFRTESNRYWDTDLDGNWTNNYYYESYSAYDAEDQWECIDYRLEDRVNYDWMVYDYELEQNRFSGEMESSTRFQIDTDADDNLGDYSDGGAYYSYNSSGFDATDQGSWSDSTIYDPFNHYYLSTNNYSTVTTGDSHSALSLSVDTDGDGYYETWGKDDYFYYESSRFEADDLDRYSSTTLYDIPNGYYYATSNYSNDGTGDFENSWQYASDTDGDDNIETWFMSDDAYQSEESGYDFVTDKTYSNSYVSMDGNNKQNAYMYSIEEHSSKGSGDVHNSFEGANLIGWYRNWDGYQVGNEYEDEGPRAYQWNQTKVWGQYYSSTASRTWDGGATGTYTEYNQDTDGDTDWDNTWDLNYEIYSEAWDESGTGWSETGWEVDNQDTNVYTEYERCTSTSGDFEYYYTSNGSTGDEAEYMKFFESGAATAYSGIMLAESAGIDYEYVWFDGGWSMLPYNTGMEIDW